MGAAVAVELAALAAVVGVGLDSSVDAAVRPASMTGTVHDVGVGGVNLRSAPQVATSTARNVALDGTALMIQCGVTGAVVSGPAGDSPLWFRTVDDKYVSMLYVRVPGRAFVPSCGASADAPLIPVVDPDVPPVPAASAPDAPSSAALPGAVDPGLAGDSAGTPGHGRRGSRYTEPRAVPVVPGKPASRAPVPATVSAVPAPQDNNGGQDNGGQNDGGQNNGGQNNGGQDNGDQPQG